MKVQTNSDKQVAVDTELSGKIEEEIRRTLGRFETHLTRVEVHLSDLNSSSKGGLRDKRCLLEVRPAGQKPVSVSFETASVEQAVRGAAGKMKRLLETSFGKFSTQASQLSARRTKRSSSSSASIKKLQQVQAVLAEILDGEAGESPRLQRYMEAANNAVKQARVLVESQDNEVQSPGVKQVAAPAKNSAARLVKKAAADAEPSAAGGRSRKKKGTYQARRKSWPGR